jgi:hypothetical protein
VESRDDEAADRAWGGDERVPPVAADDGAFYTKAA